MADSDTSIEILLSRIISMESTLSKIFKILNGNGVGGLVTKTALLEQKIEDIPKPAQLKFFALVGGAAVSGIGIISWLIYQALRSVFSGT